MKIIAIAFAAFLTATAHAAPGYFGAQEKATDGCSVTYKWGRGMLNGLVIAPATPTSCEGEARAALEAMYKSPARGWWEFVPAPPADAPDGDCILTIGWPAGQPAAFTLTFATRIGGINGTAVPTQPGCVADRYHLAYFILVLNGIPAGSVTKLKSLPLPETTQ